LAVCELEADVNGSHLQQSFLLGFRDLLHMQLPLDRSGATIVEDGGEKVNT
jgi:hypothetical protein